MASQVKPRVNKAQTAVETAGVKHSMNPFDELSVEESVRIREKNRAPGGVEDITVISAGPSKAVDVLRTALAMGADRGIHVEVKEDEELEPLSVAKLLRKVVAEHNSNLVIMGKQSIDGDSGQTGQMLAGLLGWPQATQASKVEFVQGDTINVTREVDGGVETLQAQLPIVITTDLRLNEPRYASLPNIMKAKKKPMEKRRLADYGIVNDRRLNVLKVTGMPRSFPVLGFIFPLSFTISFSSHSSYLLLAFTSSILCRFRNGLWPRATHNLWNKTNNEFTEPVQRQGGGKVDNVDALISKLKELGAL